MSAPTSGHFVHRLWRAAYRMLLVLLPRELRERHGDAMLDLFARELSRREGQGLFAPTAAAFAGLGDLLGRGLHERIADERRGFGPAERVVLKNSVVWFALAFFVLTDIMLALYMQRRASGVLSEQWLTMLWYSVPFIAAVTIPMALFVAVLAALNGKGTDATPPQRMMDSKRPLRMMPLALLGVVVSVIAYGLNTQVLPKANTELQWLQNGKRDGFRGDRSLAPHELQDRWRELEVQLAADRTQIAKRSTLETINSAKVEYHKKYAISAACLFLTLFAVALTRRMRRIPITWQVPLSVVVFAGYYLLLIVGETLGDSGALAPSLSMWSANLTLLLLTVGLSVRSGQSVTTGVSRFVQSEPPR